MDVSFLTTLYHANSVCCAVDRKTQLDLIAKTSQTVVFWKFIKVYVCVLYASLNVDSNFDISPQNFNIKNKRKQD